MKTQTAYLLEVAAWFAPFGIQAVLFPWLVTIVLQGSGSELGLVQASLMLPLVVLLPLTGSFAERTDRHQVLFICHMLAAVPALLLAAALYVGILEYWLLVACGLGYGVVTAIAMPARDAMLSEVGGTNLQKTVAAMTSIQFGVQILGFLLAGQVARTGPESLLIFQALILLAGGIIAQRFLPANTGFSRSEMTPTMNVIRNLRNTPIPAAMAINGTVGLFYISSYMVLIPILIRDRFDGGANAISLAFTVFICGMVLSNLILMSVLKLVHLGRAVISGPIAGAIVLGLMIWTHELGLLMLLLFLWGMGAGVTISSGRTLVQKHAPAHARARVLALHQLTFLGTAPIGSLLMGVSVDFFGLETTLLATTICVSLILIYMRLFTGIWELEESPG